MVLLHAVLTDIDDNLPIVVIGQSFGARATSVAGCFGPATFSPEPEQNSASIDLDRNSNTIGNLGLIQSFRQKTA